MTYQLHHLGQSAAEALLRQTERKTLLEESGWEEVPIAEIGP